jgi:hypothetical protein
LYFDFELTDRQFGSRYGENKNGFLVNEYQFSRDFLRVAINPDATYVGELTFEDRLINAIECSIIETGVRILIIDNITYLKSDNERAKDALPLMQKLKALKVKYQLSILALAHTPKRELFREITQNDLSGSKMIMNFCDSSFAMSKSTKGETIRYVKQIKERNTGKVYGSENICVAEILTPNNFLSFDFFTFGSEREHLKEKTQKDEELLIQEVVNLKAQGKTYREIGAILNISSTGSVSNYLDKAKKQDIIPNSDVQSVQDDEVVHPLFDLNNLNNLNIEKELELLE